MEKFWKRLLSTVLSVSMLISMLPSAHALETEGDGRSYFDFEASEYEVRENDGELKVKIVRHGEGKEAADVSFKAADFLSAYGTDYDVLGMDGEPLEKVSGEKPDPSEFVYDDDTDSTEPVTEEVPQNEGAEETPQNEGTGEASQDEGTEEAPQAESTEETPQNKDTEAEDEPAPEAEPPENTDKKAKSTGSPLRDAQAAYLNLPEDTEKEDTEAAVTETLDDMYSYFLAAEGAEGVVHFEKGETEKTITVRIYDNDLAEQDKVFLLALMGTNTEETTTAANATTYVTIVDDEPAETTHFDLVDGGLVLTVSDPEGYVTVQRTSGTQYFSTVYISTVTGTAPSESYEEFEGKTVAFVPGQTEQQVKVTAYDFSQDGTFGLRLEGQEDVEIGTHYVDVSITGQTEENAAAPVSEENGIAPKRAARASTVTIGNSVSGSNNSVDGGWRFEKTGDGNGSGNNNWGRMQLEQYDSGDYSMFVTNRKQNLVGVKSIRFSWFAETAGHSNKYDIYTTYFETDSDQTYPGKLDGVSKDGAFGWREDEFSLNNTGDDAYFKFAVKARDSGYDNPRGKLDWFRYNYTKYTFNLQNSAETFNRQVYDFTQGTPNVYDTYYDGATERIYKPGKVKITRGNGDTVGGFYVRDTEPITITDANETLNRSRGIRLKAVLFVKDGINDQALCQDGKYINHNVYRVEATDGKVTLTPNTDFVKTLRDKGVIDNVHGDCSISVFPVYEFETVNINFENADRDDSKAATKGKFDESHKASYFVNVLEACKAGKVKKEKYKNWLDYYQLKVPKGSIIRVQTQPDSTRTAAGVTYWYHDGRGTYTTYYQAGDTRFSSTSPNGEKIESTDYTKADIVADGSMSMKPATGKQNFDIAYFPHQDIPEAYQGEKGLTNAVVRSDAIQSEGTAPDQEVGTDKTGAYSVKNPYIGMEWSYTALSPQNYYTQWVNMTGDTDGDGYVSDEESKAVRGKSATLPDEVYGNKLSGALDQDNLKLYYYFLPKTGGGNGKKTGSVTRASENFYQIAHHQKSSTPAQPVAGAYVDVGGFVGQTDGEGDYSIACNDLPSAGNVSTTVTVDGTAYNTVSKLQKYTPIKLPALDKFTPTELSAGYAGKKPISGISIGVENNTLTVSATVESESAIKPTKARFFFYKDGTERVALENRDGYEVSYETFENQLTASLTFNPKQDMVSGDRLYVQFADQNNNWTNTIDLGYTFNTPVDLAQFVFPLVGASSMEDILGTNFVTDLIGDPMGGVDIGSISGFKGPDMTDYTPSGINRKDADKYTWARYNYSYGWDNKFYGSKKSSSAATDKAELQDYLEAIYDGTTKGKEPPSPSKYATQSKFKWSVSPSVGFNLTLSSGRPGADAGKTYFEDLVFFVKIDFGVSSKNTIQLPIGMSVLIEAALSGDVAGIYHMYVDYQDSYETEDAVPYDENFGLFKKFSNSVRREGYLFIDPKVAIGLGVGYGVVFVKGKATFDFDMDFQFTEVGTNTYGDVTFGMGWGIDLFGFEVYYKELWDHTEKMFNSEGTDGHIEFDTENANTAMLNAVGSAFSVEGDENLTLDQPTSRAYLESRSEWLGEDGGISLFSLDGTEGTTESALRTGTTDSPYVRMAELGSGKLLMVFIDDDTTRTNVNKRALYYSVYNGSTWSQPVLVDNDGTADDYPTLCDLGNGQILVAWSSAEKVLGDTATVEDMMKSMNIKAAFFDKNAGTMGAPTQLTKTTEEDFSADVLPGAAYDPTTNKVILYYTKTEYNDLNKVDDVGKAFSVNAYLFYDVASGHWSDASGYADGEVPGETQEAKDRYKENWYGQRFLDLRLDKNSDEMPRVVDASAIGYNGLGLFAWTADWDGDLNTADDRDVFMQIYNFSENSFTHIIRVTEETGNYTSPKFARSDNQTYLFYGAAGEEEHGSIMYLNVSHPIKNQQYEKVTNGNSEYYILQYELPAYTSTNPDGSQENVPAHTVKVTASTAAVCDNPSDYDVKVSDDGQMYLFWTELDGTSRQIVAAVYDGGDGDEDNDLPEDQITDNDGGTISQPETFWSEPVRLTSAVKNEYYSGLGAAVLGDDLVVASAKGNYDDKTATSLVWQKHTPFSKIRVSETAISGEYPQPLSTVNLIATVKNEGLETFNASEEAPVTVTFTQNGANIGTAKIEKPIPGGSSVDVLFSVELPENLSNVSFGAYVDSGEAANVKLEPKANAVLEDARILRRSAEDGDADSTVFSATLQNSGNAAAENVVLTAMAGETEVGRMTLTSLGANETQDINMTLDIPDAAYTLNEYGVGVAEITVSAVSGDETLTGYNGNAEKTFSAEAIALLDKVTGVTFENSGYYTMKPGEEKEIQPTIGGVDNGSLMVQWLESSDTDIAYIDYDNMICADEKGTATITGIVVPAEEQIEFGTVGIGQKVDWKTLIPEDKLITVTATITVSDTSGNTVVVITPNNGHIAVSPTNAVAGNTVILTVTPNSGYVLSTLTVTDSQGSKITLTDRGRGQYSFTMPDGIVTVEATFVLRSEEACDGGANCPSHAYTDLGGVEAWYHEAVDYVLRNKLMEGYGGGLFGPDDTLTRAQLTQILYNRAGRPAVTGGSRFTDVTSGEWYFDAVNWAASEGLVEGYGDGLFGPDDNITREQLATILYRYSGSPTTKGTLNSFTDADKASDYALDALRWAVEQGILKGYGDGLLGPQKQATRAEAAQMLKRYLKS